MATDAVTLRFPASTDRVRLARTLVATLADDAGFDYDEVEDLRIAVDELCFLLIESGVPDDPGIIELVASSSPGDLVVEGSSSGVRGPETVDPADITVQILKTVVDEYDLQLDDTAARFRFHKTKP